MQALPPARQSDRGALAAELYTWVVAFSSGLHLCEMSKRWRVGCRRVLPRASATSHPAGPGASRSGGTVPRWWCRLRPGPDSRTLRCRTSRTGSRRPPSGAVRLRATCECPAGADRIRRPGTTARRWELMDAELSIPAEVVAELRSMCLGLPEAYEEQAWVGTRWRIRGRTFAHVPPIESGWPPVYARAAKTDGPSWVLTFRSPSSSPTATASSLRRGCASQLATQRDPHPARRRFSCRGTDTLRRHDGLVHPRGPR